MSIRSTYKLLTIGSHRRRILDSLTEILFKNLEANTEERREYIRPFIQGNEIIFHFNLSIDPYPILEELAQKHPDIQWECEMWWDNRYINEMFRNSEGLLIDWPIEYDINDEYEDIPNKIWDDYFFNPLFK